ncbi:helix-turn-helix transcriptional regulator [Streptomyces sp. I05A-00742]|uniref:helix-turn-helix transcriptional regulator n=1 Tax=Streptomyces sp. I05A-00742 TaxID=2732853 RepID=UPI001487B32D|nr:helix-turn-helix transcriptional regulator [Streptomyces sp. I05A-00742]
MDSSARRRELAAFVRSRRERLSPRDAGLLPGPRRRTPGLRREEVAQLSGVSVTWYTWLEQARKIRVSRQVLDAVADALRMTDQERRHLLTLSGVLLPPDVLPDVPPDVPTDALPGVPPDASEAGETPGSGAAAGLNPLYQRLLDELSPRPAYVIGPCWDLLAWNRAHAGLIGDPLQWPAGERNMLWLLFTQPRIRSLVVGWETDARHLVGQYRAAAARHAGDPRFERLTRALSAASGEFRQWWTEHGIATFETTRKEFDHPAAGRLSLDCSKLAPEENTEVKMVIYLPADEASRAKLPLLEL